MSLGQDTLVRANQSGFGTASDGQTWTKYGPGTLAIVSNKGVITSSTGSDTHVQLGSQTSENMEVSCRIAIGHSGDICGIQARFTANGGNTTTYKLLWYGGSIHLNKAVSGTSSQLTDVAFTMTPGTFYWFRLLVSSTSLSGRIWQSGNGEPAYWITTTTDSQVTGAGGAAILGLTDASSTGIQYDSFLAMSYPLSAPNTQTQQTLETFLTLDNWVSLASSSGACAVRGDLTNSYNCQTGYLHTGAYQNTNALGINGGLVGHADVISGEKHGWQIRSRQSFTIPGIFAARLDITGETGGGTDYEKVVKSFFLFADAGDGVGYWYSDFLFCLEPNHPNLSGYPSQPVPSVLNTIIYAGSGSSFPSTGLAPTFLDTALFGDYVTCIFKVELVSSGVGTKTWKTTYQIVDLRGAIRTLGTTQTTHADTITTLQVWFDEHWVDPAGGQQTNYNWQRMDVRWLYYSADVTDQIPYTMRDSLPIGSDRHVGVDVPSNGFLFGLPALIGNVAIDATAGTSVSVLNLFQRNIILSTQQFSDYLYAFLAQNIGGVIVADTPVNIDQVGGVGVVGGNLPINIAQVGGATTTMGGSDAQTAGNVMLVAMGIYNGTTVDRLRSGQGDGSSTGLPNMIPMLYNGTNADRQRGNFGVALISASGATTTQTSADQTNYNGRGVLVVLDMTTVGTGSVTIAIQAKDSAASNKYFALLTGAAVTTNSTNIYRVYPGLTAAANATVNDILPRTWRIEVTANNANATIYTVSAYIIL